MQNDFSKIHDACHPNKRQPLLFIVPSDQDWSNVPLSGHLGYTHGVIGELTVSQAPSVVPPYMTAINVSGHIVSVLYVKD